jgi:pimeloyl-[acyl-carrier protein] methyl ester esterase
VTRRVVLLPGAAGAGAFWAPIIARLPGDWDKRAIDLPGLGAIPPQPDVNSYDDLVEHVARTISAPSAIVAQSMGSYVALQLTLRYAHLVTALVLAAATGGVSAAEAHVSGRELAQSAWLRRAELNSGGLQFRS